MAEARLRVAERDKDRLDELADDDETLIMAFRAAVNALHRERDA